MGDETVTIERMCYGGAGFGRVGGKACFVPFTAPGDEVRVRVTREKRSFLEGVVTEIVSPSALRVTPPCPLAGVCGGCDWQHLPYAEQLAQKGEIFAETLVRIGQVDRAVIRPVVPSEHPFGYRSRVQLKVSCGGGAPAIGFFRGSTHDVVDASIGCAIAHPRLDAVLGELRALLPSLPDHQRIAQFDLAMGDDGETIVIVHYDGKACGPLRERLIAGRGALPSVGGLFLRSGGKGALERVFGVEKLTYRLPADLLPGAPEVTLSFSRGGFSQINYEQNRQLIRTAWELGAFSGSERLLDLYCGNGNFSVPLARYVAGVLGVEAYAPSITDATENARVNGVRNACFDANGAAQAVRRLAARGEKFDVVLLDPPRSGADEVAEIARLEPAAIIYVSCDPPTLARDLAALAREGYRAEACVPVDMFPQTYHLESVTLLKRHL